MIGGANGRLLAGLLVGAAVAVVVESGVIYGFVGAAASMGAIALVCIAGAAAYGTVKLLQRSGILRSRGRWECHSTAVAPSGGHHSGLSARGKTAKPRPVTDKDKRVIMAHIDELIRVCRDRDTEKCTQPGPISEEDKKMIMGHVDELPEMGHEHSGEVQS